MSNNFIRLAAITSLLLGGVASAHAQTLTIDTVSAPVGGTVQVAVTFTPGATPVQGYDIVYSYDNSILAGDPVDIADSATGPGFSNCTVDAAAQTVTVSRAHSSPLTAEHVGCAVEFTIDAAAAAGSYPLVHDPATTGFFDGLGDPASGTFVDGEINVVLEGPPTIDINPPANPIVLTGGTYIGETTGDTTIPVALTRLAGAGDASYSCSGDGTSSPFTFAPASQSGFTNDPSTGNPDDILVSCERGPEDVTGEVTCTRTGGDTADVVFDVTCPAGIPRPGELPGGTTSHNGTENTPASGTQTLENVGESSIDYACVLDPDPNPDGFTITAGASGTLAAGATGALSVGGSNYPAAGDTTSVTVTCSWAGGSADYVFDFTGQPVVTAPTFIPATSLWSKFALIGVFAALGLLMVGLRRNH